MNKYELIVNALRNKGLAPYVDDDGDVYFKYQMKHLFVLMNKSDDDYYNVFIPRIYSVDEDDVQIILAACNKMTREIRCMKTFLDDQYKYVCSTFEFYATEETLSMQIDKALDVIARAPIIFSEQIDEINNLKNEK